MADQDDQSSFTSLLKKKISSAFAPASARADEAIQENHQNMQAEGMNPNQYNQDMTLPLQQRLKKVQKGFTGE